MQNTRGRVQVFQFGLLMWLLVSMIAHSAEPLSGSERRPDLSLDPFERTRDAINKLPSSPVSDTETKNVQIDANKRAEVKIESEFEPNAALLLAEPMGKAIMQSLLLTADYFSLATGGDPSSDVNSGSALLVEYVMRLNSAGFGLWRDGVLHTQLMFYLAGTNSPSGIVGDFNGLSSIDYGNDNASKLLQLWYEQEFLYSKSAILFGLHNMDTEFYRAEYGRLFINNSFRMGMVLRSVAKPSSYPYTSLGVRYKSALLADSYILAGVYDGRPATGNDPTELRINKREGSFNIVEMGVVQSARRSREYFKLALGAWYLNQKVSEFAGLSENFDVAGVRGQFDEPGIGGIYFLGERALGDSLGLFAMAGHTESRISRVDRFVAMGLNFSGLIPGRSKDIFGVGVSHSRQSDAFIQANKGVDFDSDGIADDCCFTAETTFEMTYKVTVSKWLIVQPDVQFIHQPAMSFFLGNTYVVGIRLRSLF